MEFTLTALEMPVRLRLERPMTDDELLRFSACNESLRIEREPDGELSIMSPGGLEVGDVEAEVSFQLRAWANAHNSGKTFSSSAGFRLPDGSVRSPDASFLRWSKWNALTREQTRKYAPVCPDFVVEVRSPTDRWKALQGKMRMWVENGAELAWLIDPERKVVEVYRPGATLPDLLEGVTAVYGEGPVAGFVLEMANVWR